MTRQAEKSDVKITQGEVEVLFRGRGQVSALPVNFDQKSSVPDSYRLCQMWSYNAVKS